MLAWAVGGVVLAGIPDGVRVSPVAATPDVLERFARWQTAHGASPSQPLCQPLPFPEVQLCFRVWEGNRRRWVTEADGDRWEVTPRELRARIESHCVESVGRIETRRVEGASSRYAVLADGDGWAVSGILCPSAIAKAASWTSFRAALPTEHLLLLWPGGDRELDQIMAVGVREIHDTQSNPLTSQIVRFDGEGWRVYGRAIPR